MRAGSESDDDDEYDPGAVVASSSVAVEYAAADDAEQPLQHADSAKPAGAAANAAAIAAAPTSTAAGQSQLAAGDRRHQIDADLRARSAGPAFPGMSRLALRAHTKAVLSIAISPCGSILCSGGKDGQLCMWDFLPLTKQMTAAGEALASAAAAGPAGQEPPGGTTSLALKPTRILTPFPHRMLEDHFMPVVDLSWSSGGAFFVAAEDGDRPLVVQRNGAMGQRCIRGQRGFLNPVKAVGHSASVTGVDCSPRQPQRFLSVGGLDLTARVWDVNTMERSSVFAISHGSGRIGASDACDQLLCGAYASPELPGCAGGAMAPFVTAGTDCLAQLWDERTPYKPGKPLAQTKLPTQPAAVCSMRSHLAVRCSDGLLYFYDLRKFSTPVNISAPLGPFHHTGATSKLCAVFLGDTEALALVTSARGFGGREEGGGPGLLQPGGHAVLAAGPSGATVTVTAAAAPSVLHTVRLSAHSATTICAARDASFFASGSQDGVVDCMWAPRRKEASSGGAATFASWISAWEAACAVKHGRIDARASGQTGARRGEGQWSGRGRLLIAEDDDNVAQAQSATDLLLSKRARIEKY